MNIVFEIPQRFRITHVPVFARGPGGPAVHRGTPFVLTYRAEGADKAEQAELSNELFAAVMTLLPAGREPLAALLRHIPDLGVSEGMLDGLSQAPTSLLALVPPVPPQSSRQSAGWQEPEAHPAPDGETVWVTQVVRQGFQAPHYEGVTAYRTVEGWFLSETHEPIPEPDYYHRLPAMPPFKSRS